MIKNVEGIEEEKKSINMNSLFSLVLKQEKESITSLLYRGKCTDNDEGLLIKSGSVVSFDTYINMFPISQLRNYTTSKNFVVSIQIKGTGRIELIGLNQDNSEYLIRSVKYDCNDLSDIEIFDVNSINVLPEYCYIRIISETDSVINKGGLYTDEEPSQYDLKIACCFCTYKREKELIQNVNNIVDGIINNPKSILYQCVDVFVSDNGHTLMCNQFRDKSVHLFENKNYGGSAGFTRCMMEAKWGQNSSNYSHIILMDDDAVINSFVIERTAELLRFLRSDYQKSAVGGAMLSLMDPCLQLENGSLWNGFYNEILGNNIDLSDREKIIVNQNEQADYNAWFYICIPSSTVTEDNLPLPVFIHGDDINYGIRDTNKIISMNGICIWHPNPLVRSRSYMEYYDARNYKIVDPAFSASVGSIKAFVKDFKAILLDALSYRYEEAHYRIKGCKDYLKGIDWLKKLDAEKYNAEIINWKKNNNISFDNDKGIHFSEPIVREKTDKKRLVINWLLPTQKKEVFYTDDNRWTSFDVYRTKRCIVLNKETMKGVVMEKKYRQLAKVVFASMGLFVSYCIKYRNVSKEWSNRISELYDYSFWKEYLDI